MRSHLKELISTAVVGKLKVKVHVLFLSLEGEKSTPSTEGAREAAGIGERSQCPEASEADPPVHASARPSSGPDTGSASKALARGEQEVHVRSRDQQLVGVLLSAGYSREEISCMWPSQFTGLFHVSCDTKQECFLLNVH